jgi:hypothetical protein
MSRVTDQHDPSLSPWFMHHLFDRRKVKLFGGVDLTDNVTHRLGEVAEGPSEALDPSLRRIRNGSGRDPIGVAVHLVASCRDDEKRTAGA